MQQASHCCCTEQVTELQTTWKVASERINEIPMQARLREGGLVGVGVQMLFQMYSFLLQCDYSCYMERVPSVLTIS